MEFRVGAGLFVRVLRALSEIEACRQEWLDLLDACGCSNAFASFPWIVSWFRRAASMPGAPTPYVVSVRSGGRLEAIVPLQRRLVGPRAFPIRKLETANLLLTDYGECLIARDPDLAAGVVASYLAEQAGQWDLLDLRGISESPNLESLERGFRLAGLDLCRRHDSICPFVRIEGTWEAWLRKRSSRSRRKWQLRAAAIRSAGMRARIVESMEPGLFERMAAVEANKPENDRLLSSRYSAFFQSLLPSLAAEGRLYIALLEREGELISYEFGFRAGAKLWVYNKAYDPAYARLSPGFILIPEVFDYALRAGCQEYDFLRGEEDYKRRVASGCHETWRVLVHSRRPRSLAAWSLFSAFRRPEAKHDRFCREALVTAREGGRPA